MTIPLPPKQGRSGLLVLRVSEADRMTLEQNAKKMGFGRVCDYVRSIAGLEGI